MRRIILVMLMLAVTVLQAIPQEPSDSDRLDMAIDYFNSGKYHEALLILEKLDQAYQLNPRLRAYMGVCYYYEWLYEEACRYLDDAIPHLDVFAPHERSVYYYTDAESHFQLQQYAEAIPYYEKALTVCFENEKGDIYYRLGFCYMFAENWEKAHQHFKSALDNYLQYRNHADMNARITQTAHVMKGCEEHLREHAVNDSIMTANAVSDSIMTANAVNDSIMTASTMSDSISNGGKIRVNIVRDTISNKVVEGVNIDDIYRQKTEVQE